MEIVRDLTSEIIKKHLEFELSLRTTISVAIDVGEILQEQKEELGHGDFTTWMEENLPFSVRTAQNYMRLFSEKDKLLALMPKDLTEAYLMIAPPKKVEEEPLRTMEADPTDNDIVPEYVPAEPVPHTQITQYDYWIHLEQLILKMKSIHEKLAATRNSTTPEGLGYMIGNIRDMATVLETWDPATIGSCDYCEDGCDKCINGKSGSYRESEN